MVNSCVIGMSNNSEKGEVEYEDFCDSLSLPLSCYSQSASNLVLHYQNEKKIPVVMGKRDRT